MDAYRDIITHLEILVEEPDIISQDLTPEQFAGLQKMSKKIKDYSNLTLPEMLKFVTKIIKLDINIEKLEQNCRKTIQRKLERDHQS
jgi:hypothetical protein